MPQILFNRDDAVKRTAGSFLPRPISKNVSYSRHQRHLNDKEEKLMKKLGCGYSTLVKSLIAERYQREFGEVISPFL